MACFRAVSALVVLTLIAPAGVAQPDERLPEGARLRLGSAGFAVDAGIGSAALSPDGKYLVAGGNTGLAIFDRGTGKRLAQVGNNGAFFGGSMALTFSPTGKVIAFGEFRNVALAEVPSGRVLRRLPVKEPNFHQAHGLSFSADGKVVAVGMNMPGNRKSTKAFVWEVATGKALGTFEAIQNWSCATALSPDGKVLATWGQYQQAFVPGVVMNNQNNIGPGQTIQLWDIATGKELRQLKIDRANMQISAAAFAPDGKTLAVASGMSTFHLFDPHTGKELRHFAGRRGNLANLCFSPDGRLLVAGSFDGGVQAWDIVADKRLDLAAGPKAQPLSFAFPEKGQIVALGIVGQTLIWWDAITGKTSKTAPGHYAAVIGLGFSADGRTLRSASPDAQILTWDTATGKLLHERTLVDEETMRMGGNLRNAFNNLALSPDGRFAATSSVYGRNSVRLWELASGQAVCDFESGTYSHDYGMAFSGDGRRLATAGAARRITLWDTDAGREAAVIAYDMPGNQLGGTAPRVACSPDGKRIAMAADCVLPQTGVNSRLFLFDAKTGKVILAIPASANYAIGPDGRTMAGGNIAFSPDSKLLALPGDNSTVTLLRADSGKEDRRLALGGSGTVSAMVFSPDGRTLAMASGGDRSFGAFGNTPTTMAARVQVWELASGRMRTQFTGHVGPACCLAFSADSGTLASGSTDTTVILWDAAGSRGKKPRTLTARELTTAWTALAQPDAKAAFQAQRDLIASPAESTAFLREHLRPAEASPVNMAKINALVADLDNESFEQCDEASRELVRFGTAAEPALRKARAGAVSLEMRRRIDDLLARLERRALTKEELQATRAVEVLERIAMPEARELLQSLARGSPDAVSTVEANAALGRMKQ